MDLNNQNIRKIKELIVFTAVLVVALWKYTLVLDLLKAFLNLIFPFLLGGAIAFVLNVPMHFLENKVFNSKSGQRRKHLSRAARPLSLILTIMFVIGIVVLVMFVVVPELGSTVVSLGKTLQDFLPRAQAWLEDLFNNNKDIQTWMNNLQMDWEKVIDGAINFLKNGASNVLDSTMAAAANIVSGMATFVIAVVFACYILLQKEKLNIQVRKVLLAFIPKARVAQFLEISSLTYKTFSSFLTGQCVEALILGTMFFVIMSILRLPYALLVGVLIAFTALIPIFGAFIGCAVGAFLILMVNPMQALIFVILFLVLQQIEGNLIYPRVVGGSVGLPSIWVLAAVSIGGSLMGIVGMLIFIPIISVIYTLFRETVYKRLQEKKIQVP